MSTESALERSERVPEGAGTACAAAATVRAGAASLADEWPTETGPSAREPVPVLRLAIVGCGAVTEKRYLPAAASLPDATVTHLVDLDVARARALAEAFSVPEVTQDYRQALGDIDALVVATPPGSHAEVAIECLAREVHVLCEKPMAPDLPSAEAMAAAAERSGAILSVGMVRRLGRSVRLLRRFVRLGLVGEIEHVEAEEGGEFNWPLQSANMFVDAAQGGVLRDTGTHLLDLVQWIAGGQATDLHDYADDSWGGPEANAAVDFAVQANEATRPIPARVEVSFTRALDNRLRVHGSKGWIEAPTLGGHQVRYRGTGDPELVTLSGESERGRSRVEDFVLQLEGFLEAIRGGGPPPVSAAEAVATVRLIDACHRRRTIRPRSWEVAPSTSGEKTDE